MSDVYVRFGSLKYLHKNLIPCKKAEILIEYLRFEASITLYLLQFQEESLSLQVLFKILNSFFLLLLLLPKV